MKAFGLLVLVASLPAVAQSDLAGRVHVVDGNTIQVVADGHTTTLRLHGMAAPEPGQPGADEAAAFLEQYAEAEPVRCTLAGAEFGYHALATCYVAGFDIAAAVVRAGLARDCPAFSGGRYWAVERPEAQKLPLPDDCRDGIPSRQPADLSPSRNSVRHR